MDISYMRSQQSYKGIKVFNVVASTSKLLGGVSFHNNRKPSSSN
jgi:hypothetical protein